MGNGSRVNLTKWFTLRRSGAVSMLNEVLNSVFSIDGFPMKPSRLFCASMMTFWMVFLSMLALVFTHAPQGGAELAGLVLFAGPGLIEPILAAMNAIGLSATTQSVMLGLLGGFNLGAAGLILFSMLFSVFGEEAEQRDARPLADGAAACVSAAGAGVVVIAFAGGVVGTIVFLQLLALGGAALMVLALARPDAVDATTGDKASDGIDDVIAGHAATHAAFSAQIASLSRREYQS